MQLVVRFTSNKLIFLIVILILSLILKTQKRCNTQK